MDLGTHMMMKVDSSSDGKRMEVGERERRNMLACDIVSTWSEREKRDTRGKRDKRGKRE